MANFILAVHVLVGLALASFGMSQNMHDASAAPLGIAKVK